MIITARTYRPTVTAAPSAATYSLLPVTYTLNFAFSAKERDVETGLSYFEARYYSSDLSIWLSVDPMSDKYPSLSPYVYCADNPVKLVDPEGEEFGDYFDQNGKYIGTDLVDDGKIHIIQDDLWQLLGDAFSWVGNDGNSVISPNLASDQNHGLFSNKPSELNLSDNAIKEIVGHYNNTGLELHYGTKAALYTTFERNTSPRLSINTQKWRKNTFLDNYFDIISTFDNEKGHIQQYKEVGIVALNQMSDYQREEYAVQYQKSQPVFSRTDKKYKRWVDEYLESKSR